MVFNWCIDEAMTSLLDPSALVRTQHFRTDQYGKLVEVAESSVDPMHSIHEKRSKHGLCYWHKVLHCSLTTQIMSTYRLAVDIRNPV